jgi:putative peptidoglycan lipid II flippase
VDHTVDSDPPVDDTRSQPEPAETDASPTLLTETEDPPVSGSGGFSMRGMGRSTVMLTAGSASGQVFTVIRTLFVAYAIGVSASLDAILVAVAIPTVVGLWLSNVVGPVLVSTYQQITHRSGDAAARRFLGAVLTYIGIAAILAMVIVVALAGATVAVSGPGLAPDARRLAVAHVPVLVPTLAFIAMSNLGVAIAQIGKAFGAIAISWALGPVASLVVTIGLWDQLGITAYALGTTVGAGTMLVVLAVAAYRKGLLPRPSLRADRRDVLPFVRHVAPMVGASGVLSLNLVTDRAVATLVSAGATSALTYGQQLVTGPAGALANSWSTVVYPAVVQAGGTGVKNPLGAAMTSALRYTLVVFVPLTVMTAALAPLIVNVAYGRGAFDREAVRTTVTVVAAFAPMLLLTMIQPVLIAAHNVRGRGTLLGITGIANALLNVVLNVAFAAVFGVAGIALSSSVTLAILLAWLTSRIPADEAFRVGDVARPGVRVLAASLLPGVPIALLAWSVGLDVGGVASFALLVGGGLAMAAGYLLASRALGVTEPGIMLEAVLGPLRRRWRRDPST